ncbi:LacI family DNA-binding transcriptional regulator [Sphingomonas sp. ERG5]|uniref:LacI family DNA-binding transcriptional regulator n=1 Tax=Sphingomonas sp. ERG5 TaxID=1381597 RepID=UPI00054B8F5B|nr:LacI family DNA-binding transcriptional regulator [Sphingomonas sp. ERG5]
MHATIRDVAREAAVSVATVSRVLNGHSNVRPALKQHVEDVAARLGYVPHAGARNLSLARSGAIGVVLPDLHGEFYSELLRGIDREASSRDLQLLLTVMHDRPGRGIDVLRTMHGRVDGIVLMAPHIPQGELVGHLPAGLPTLLVNCGPDDGNHAGLRVDNQAGAIAMIEHLVAIGRRRIAYIGGPDDNFDALERRRGVEIAAARAGVAVRTMPGDFSQEAGTTAAAELLKDLRQVDAIFAANDMMAIGALMMLKRAGIAVPDQVAVAGFDDVPLAHLISPSLTTMRIDTAAFGARAVARLADIVSGTTNRTVEPVTPTLVVRESTNHPSLGEGRSTGEHSI